MAVLPKKDLLCAASQLAQEGPTDLEDARTPGVNQNPMMMMMMMMMMMIMMMMMMISTIL